MPVLWICGAPGVGKSVTAWELFTSDAHAEAYVSYLDIDQLGMLYPESADDPEGVELKQRALAAVRANYSRRGARFLIVSGVVDPAYLGENAHHCLLTTQPDTLRQRIMERGWSSDDADEAVSEQEDLIAAGFADDVIDTTGLPPAEVADRVRASFSRRRGLPSSEPRSAPSRQARQAPSLLINGPRGAGCSTVSFGLAQRRWQSGVPTGFLDLDQLSFARAPGRAGHTDLGLGLVNVATMRDVFSHLGAHDVIVNAHLTTAGDLRQARRWNATTVVRLGPTPGRSPTTSSNDVVATMPAWRGRPGQPPATTTARPSCRSRSCSRSGWTSWARRTWSSTCPGGPWTTSSTRSTRATSGLEWERVVLVRHHPATGLAPQPKGEPQQVRRVVAESLGLAAVATSSKVPGAEMSDLARAVRGRGERPPPGRRNTPGD